MNVTPLSEYAAVETIRDGKQISIKAISTEDKQELLEGFHRLSPKSVYFRMFSAKKDLTPAELEYYTNIDFKDNVALVVWLNEDGDENIIGGGRYSIFKREPAVSAEVAFSVLDTYQGLGIASFLLKHLVDIGRQAGVDEFYATVLPKNNAMLRVFEKSGLQDSVTRSTDEVEVRLLLNR